MIHSHHDRPKVAIFMITYNHEKYIQQAVEGVLMQQCNFEFEILIDSTIQPTDEEIPGMLIQPFVENAILHGLMTKKINGKFI